jgi:hypothetical protein
VCTTMSMMASTNDETCNQGTTATYATFQIARETHVLTDRAELNVAGCKYT